MLAPISQDNIKAASDEASRLVQEYAERSALPFVVNFFLRCLRST